MTDQERLRILRLKQMQAQQASRQSTAPAQPPEGYFPNPQTGQMTSRALMAQNANPSRMDAMASGYLQGYTYGGADEAMSGLGGGDPEMRNFRTEQARAMRDASREKYPVMTGVSEFAGAVVSPVSALAKAQSVGGALVKGAGLGGAYAGLSADEDRGAATAQGAALGGIFGAGAQATANVGSAVFRRMFSETAKRPTVEGLRAVKNAAYREVDQAGEVFSPREMRSMLRRLSKELDDLDYVPEVDAQTKAAIDVLAKRSGAPQTIGQLDKVRQSLWSRYNRTKEEGVYAAIDAIDDLIASRSSTNDLMQAARLAHGRYKKAELLEMAFQKAADQTASTGSGGNILNKYKQAVTAIKNNPKHAKWFTAEEIAQMQKLIDGGFTENQLRRLGKLSPSGNGLMLALNLGAVAVDPTMIAVTAAGAGAKATADRMGVNNAGRLLDVVSGYKPPANPSLMVGGPAAASQEQLRRYLGNE